MCGIVGAVGKHIDHNFLLDVFLATEPRGKEATGFFSPTTGIIKAPQPAGDFLLEHAEDYHKAVTENKIFIGHCRLATHGKPEFNYNNHPLESENWVLVHNGVVDIVDIEDYRYQSDTDTENILAYIERYGLEKGLSYVTRGAAIILAPKNEENTLYVWKTTNSDMLLAYDQDHECIYICSGDKYIKAGLDNISEYEERLDGLFSKSDRRIKLSEPFSRDLWRISVVDDELNAKRVVKKMESSYKTIHNRYSSYNHSWMWQYGTDYDWDEDLSAFQGVGTGKYRPSVMEGKSRSAEKIKDDAYEKFVEYQERRRKWNGSTTPYTPNPTTGRPDPTTTQTTGTSSTCGTTNKSVVKNGNGNKFVVNDYVELVRDLRQDDAIYTTAGFLINEIGKGTMFQINRVLINERYVVENYNGDIFTIPENLLRLAECPSCYGVTYTPDSNLCIRSCMWAVECQDICETMDVSDLPECVGTFDEECDTCTECWYLNRCLHLGSLLGHDGLHIEMKEDEDGTFSASA